VERCLEKIRPNTPDKPATPDETDLFRAVAKTTLIGPNKIPAFLLNSQLPLGDPVVNTTNLDSLCRKLKSLVQVTEENGVRFYSFHPFTQRVLKDMIDSKQYDKDELLCELAEIFVRYFSKDNRFSTGDFLQRTIRQHAELFLRQWNKNRREKYRTSIALVQLSEIVGFTYTQQKPVLEDKIDEHFQNAKEILEELGGITEEDFHPPQENRPDPGENVAISHISERDVIKANRLFERLREKSSKLSVTLIKDLVFSRAVSEQDLALFREVVGNTFREGIDSTQPLSEDEVSTLVQYDAALDIKVYRELFLPELYLSLIYSYGRNYFYKNREKMENPSFYVNLLRLAYCLSVEIKKRMQKSPLHEYLVQCNGLLYLLANDDKISEGNRCIEKEPQERVTDLKRAISGYEKLMEDGDETKFFEKGLLKKTKKDTYSEVVCRSQILKCYNDLRELEAEGGDRDRYIKAGVEQCERIEKLLETSTNLVRYSSRLKAVANFYKNINRTADYSRVMKKIPATDAGTGEASEAEGGDRASTPRTFAMCPCLNV
jgi:hypothetical protein